MIRYFASHPTAANLLMVAFIVAGLFAWPTLQRETFPRVDAKRVEVSVLYPGARAEDIEEAICQRIEDAIDGIDNVEEISCDAKEGSAKAVVEMEEGSNLDRFTADVKTEIESITDFPDRAEQATIRQLGRTDFVASVAITGPKQKADLKALAERTKDRMLRFGGIPKIEVKGFSDHQIRIELADRTLRQFGLSVADIATAIQRQSVDLPAGNITTEDRDLLVRFADERKSIDGFRDIVVVASADGGQIRLGDIATISDRFELDEKKILFNGQPAAILDITKTPSDDTLDVIDAVNTFLEHERAIAPPGVEFVLNKDVSSIVKDRLSLLLTNGAQGLALVFLTLWLFFGLRYSFWVVMGLPVSFLGAIVLMVQVGYTINMLTMVGLLIVIGLLMDDAIVIAENIVSHRSQGKTPLDAAVDGTKQVIPSVFASFITTSCIFGSLAFLQGDLGQILRVVPVVMLFVLVVSLVEAFFILPSHLSHSMGSHGDKPGRVQTWVDDKMSHFRDHVIGPIADKAVEWRYLTTGCAFAALILAISVLAGGYLKFSPFPELDGDVMEARILLPQGTPLQHTEAVVAKVRGALEDVDRKFTPEQPDGQPLVKSVGIKYSENTDANETGAHVVTLTADLLGSEIRSTTIDQAMDEWRVRSADIADVIWIKFAEAQVGPAGLAIEIRLQGPDLSELKKASLELQKWLRGYAGTFNITDDLRPGKPEVLVRLRDGASPLGVDAQMIADQLRTAFFGSTVDEIQVNGESYEVDVRLRPMDRNSLSDLDYFTISSAAGDLIPLSAVADVTFGRGYSRINRVNGQRTITIQGDVDTTVANANEVLADTQARFFTGMLERYPSVQFALEGANKNASTTQKSMIQGFLLGLIGVFLMLSFLFKSYAEPLVVMMIIPFAFIGAVGGHVLLGLDFTMPSMLGFVALAGVVVNDSILLVNFIKHYHGETKSVALAAPQASRARFRAVFLTSVTTIVGLLPMLSETSLQAQILIPLVTSLCFGLLVSTVLVLFLVPAVYAIFDDFGWAKLD